MGSLMMAADPAVEGEEAQDMSSDDPVKLTQRFYIEVRERAIRGLPREEDWNVLKSFMTPELAATIEKAQAVQAATPAGDKPPWIEGDLFSSNFEGADSQRTGALTLEGDKAKVELHMTYTEGSHTVTWTDALVLKKTDAGWRVDDLVFKDKQKLSDALKAEP